MLDCTRRALLAIAPRISAPPCMLCGMHATRDGRQGTCHATGAQAEAAPLPVVRSASLCRDNIIRVLCILNSNEACGSACEQQCLPSAISVLMSGSMQRRTDRLSLGWLDYWTQ